MAELVDTGEAKKTIKSSDVVYREDLYPRFKPNPQAIQQYAENLGVLPPIEINQLDILIDGYHRWKAYQTAGVEEIPCVVTQTGSDNELLLLAVRRNSQHGQQLTPDEKKRYAVRWWDQLKTDEICDALSISQKTFKRWTTDKQKQKDSEVLETIKSMWLHCYTQQEIADAVGEPLRTINDKIADFGENGQVSDSAIFGDFTPELYSVWNFGKATNEVRHFGNIPPEIIDNLLYYYTEPGQVVFDPFGGGGSTLDICEKRFRRCFISDLTPIPARERDIRQHDITSGLPEMPLPDFVFLDPPYWKQAEKKYSTKETDLGNVDLDRFLSSIAEIAKDIKRKWASANRSHGYLALIIGPMKQAGEKIDLAIECQSRIAKYIPLIERIIVPYSTQVHGGAYVAKAKESKQILYLHRDLMVFRWDSSKD